MLIIAPLMAILYQLLAHNRDLRHELAQEKYIYYTVFRGKKHSGIILYPGFTGAWCKQLLLNISGLLLHRNNTAAIKHGASLLFLVLFDETASGS